MDVDKPKKKKKSSDESIKKEKKKKSKDTTSTPTIEATLSSPDKKEKKKRKRETTADEPDKKKKKSKKETKLSATDELEIDITAPTPPSKKALRLEKKGKAIPKLEATSQPPTTLTPTTSTAEDSTHPDRKKLVREIPQAEFSVWIGNLSYKSDVKGLRGWLVRGDKRITDKQITRMNLPLNADGQSKGFAYVDLLTQEAMEKVISRSEENFDGRNLLIKNGKSFEGRPAEKKQRYQVKLTPVEGARSGRIEGNDGVKTDLAETTDASPAEVPRPKKTEKFRKDDKKSSKKREHKVKEQ